MKSLKNISLAVALLVAGSQAEAGFWTTFKNMVNGTPKTVKTVGNSIVDGAKYLGNSTVKGAKYLGNGSIKGAKFLGKNSKKVANVSVDLGKKHWKKAAIVTAALGTVYGIYSFYNWFTKKDNDSAKQGAGKIDKKTDEFIKKSAQGNSAVYKELLRAERIKKNRNNMIVV